MKNLLKKMLKKILGSIAFDHLTQRRKYLLTSLKGGYFAINELDKKLEKYVNYNDGFYVELGANDGVSQSNSLYFEKKRNWSGILIEPSSHNFLLCKAHRSDKNHIYCNACVSFEFKDKYVDIQYANLMSISENLDLDLGLLLDKDEDHIQDGEKFLAKDEPVFSFGAEATTLNSILEKSNAPREIDFLSLDVEGAELDVLKGIDFGKYSFKYMLIEVRNFKRLESFLEKNGYFLKEKFSTYDYLFEFTKNKL